MVRRGHMRLLVVIAVLASTVGLATPVGAGAPPGTGPVDLALALSDTGEIPVLVLGGPGTPFEYRIEVTNHGDADASAAATVTDVLPAPFVLDASPAVAPAGVACVGAAPLLTCTVPAGQLRAGDVVVITVRAFVPAETLGGTYLNAAMVTSADDPAPCAVAAGVLACSTATDNADDEPSDLILIGGEAAAAPATELAFTGTATRPLLVLATVLLAVGGVMVWAGRRRRCGDGAR